MPKTFTVEEVAKHNKENDIWIIIDGKVYDVLFWLDDHPGGKKNLLKMAGKDATNKFKSIHPDYVLEKVEYHARPRQLLPYQ
ncbi:cytochrome b5-like heme/steroid binding domain-containing protein [Blyttiomyces helicus]|uniref:Cytochrome b5-like heme/steroid binding domain-containing protein n=1 Tax=Blyttiomyces helicus TaxID=388810 RepID=A0A4P9WD12_9FUNG|nr:cytochrome b5-like heme/steroid binding domain-containing protein [Blyttiomyces helicus]|eukprot:RKO89575.1 cytochrome b5-like heme/steroid binding domain-containing protein [Blyttiomyces helicus]